MKAILVDFTNFMVKNRAYRFQSLLLFKSLKIHSIIKYYHKNPCGELGEGVCYIEAHGA